MYCLRVKQILCECICECVVLVVHTCLQGPVTQITGTLNFSAASLSNGDLLIFSAAGRRLFPPICVGGQAAFMSHNDGWLLLVLTTQGNVRYGVFARVCLCRAT